MHIQSLQILWLILRAYVSEIFHKTFNDDNFCWALHFSSNFADLGQIWSLLFHWNWKLSFLLTDSYLSVERVLNSLCADVNKCVLFKVCNTHILTVMIPLLFFQFNFNFLLHIYYSMLRYEKKMCVKCVLLFAFSVLLFL